MSECMSLMNRDTVDAESMFLSDVEKEEAEENKVAGVQLRKVHTYLKSLPVEGQRRVKLTLNMQSHYSERTSSTWTM